MKKKSEGKPSKKSKKTTDMDFGTAPLSKEDISEVLAGMRADLGDGVMLADGTDLNVGIRGVISTQCVALDAAIGRGGVPLGRLTILHGPEGCGKTTLALHVVAECQRKGGIAVYLDKEYKLDMEYAEKMGVDRSRFFLHQPSTLEEAFMYHEVAIKHAALLRERIGRRVPVVCVLDSMNAAITKAQFDGEWDSQHMAPQARVYSQNLPKLMPIVYREDVALVWISQVRQKMNVKFGNDEEIAGGKGPRFYASLIIHIRRVGSLKKNDEAFGNLTKAVIRKNQIAPPFREAEFVIRYGFGIDNERSILEQAVGEGVVEKSGSWFAYDGNKLGQGMDAAADFLRERTEVRDEIWQKVQELS